MQIKPARALRGELSVPGDKSISHRGVMFGALAKGETRITNFLNSADCLSTIDCFRKMGISISQDGDGVVVHGRGLNSFKAPQDILYTGNSGTTTRLMTGILAAQPFSSVVDGDASIRTRPMSRIITPLTQMGASIISAPGGCCPLSITGKQLHGIEYTLPVASAQLKSCLLLAGLYAEGETIVHELSPSRNHTELMLRAYGAKLETQDKTITVHRADALHGISLEVPGDISSAAFFLVCGCILPNSELTLRNVGVNETRTGILDVLRNMGADITLSNLRTDVEPVADITVKSSALHGCDIGGDLIPRLIDELPVIAVAAAFASGTTTIRDAGELKHKESNRIAAMVCELKKAGAAISETEDGMIIHGGAPLHGAKFETYHDHRIAMAMAVCALNAAGPSELTGAQCVDISYPSFFSDLEKLRIG